MQYSPGEGLPKRVLFALMADRGVHVGDQPVGGDLIVLVVCSVTLGNLLTLLLIIGWRGFLHGRPHSQSAPIWSYIAIFLGSLFPLLALLALLDAVVTAVW